MDSVSPSLCSRTILLQHNLAERCKKEKKIVEAGSYAILPIYKSGYILMWIYEWGKGTKTYATLSRRAKIIFNLSIFVLEFDIYF